MAEFCVGYAEEPFRTLAASYPDETAYPPGDFRVEWGPIFHRGRLDGSARILLIGQDPGQHENVLRRILSGEAGSRVQGFLAKIGITRSYVLINALLYSVYGANGSKYVAKPKVATYRNQWIDGILSSGNIAGVVNFGGMSKKAWDTYVKAKGAAPANIQVHNLIHPTFPESAGGTAAIKATNTKKMLQNWNAALASLHGVVQADVPTPLVPYGAAFKAEDKVDIPSLDLPAGTPNWMFDNDGWAKRVGASPKAKRANITITVPPSELP